MTTDVTPLARPFYKSTNDLPAGTIVFQAHAQPYGGGVCPNSEHQWEPAKKLAAKK